MQPPPQQGRGASFNPQNRFQELEFVMDEEYLNLPEEDRVSLKTQFFKENAKTAISTNDSPDVGMEASLNPYRGCEHGCIYCYARPTHEYFSLSAGLDFETKIFVKHDAPELLRKELQHPKWIPKTVALSGVTDAYQPAERQFRLTRKCLEIFLEYRNPVAIITKSELVTRDIDIFKKMYEYRGIGVFLSVTSLDHDLASVLEPRASRPAARLRTIEMLAKNEIPVGVNVAPVIPGLTDHELPAILKACWDAGARQAGYVLVRLPYAVKDLFEEWVKNHEPLKASKILNRIRDTRGGELYKSDFNSRMRGEGEYAKQIETLFRLTTRKIGFNKEKWNLSTTSFRRDPGPQLSFFE